MKLFLVFVLFLIPGGVGAQFSLQYLDGAGSGFFAGEAVTPVGGNEGTTLGEQRRLVLEEAVRIWEEYLELAGPVRIDARFSALGCSTVANAVVGSLLRDFPEAPEPATWYVAALVNHLAGEDRFPNQGEILITVNRNVAGSAACPFGPRFYYGLDSETPPGQVNLLAVLLHEIAHGLGFTSFVDGNGEPLEGYLDAFSRFIFDEQANASWEALGAAERTTAAFRPALTWQGRGTRLAAPHVLSRGPEVIKVESGELVVLAPPAAIGIPWPEDPLQAPWIVVDDGVDPASDACSAPFLNAAAIAGKVALIDRGTCPFVEKALRAQEAGAVAVIIANNVPDEPLLVGGETNPVTIPVLGVTQAQGAALRALAAGSELVFTSGEGGSLARRPFLNTPATFEASSSLSHWAPEMTPDLLMEPSISPSADAVPDLCLTVLREMGWTVRNIPFPHLDYEMWLQDNPLSPPEPGADADGDGVSNFEEYARGTAADERRKRPGLSFADGAVVFRLNHQAGDVAWEVEESSDLQQWGPLLGGEREEVSEVAEEPLLREWAQPVGELEGRRFFRLQIRGDGLD
ncbi:PA domain-containing protein [Roseibacillus ishigakijimensis]|uniref:PA domain-containing protein n=1 Tax=Roseibacillus ishigakijimensis TaxID=454146 RepID=A0A934RP57_9BACT|nr:PA domain-containing protein [Roseibacillus ishigakijimensis]MBK1835417.1 hypothetical protein [Roseibacillus ishigakijimensis]